MNKKELKMLAEMTAGIVIEHLKSTFTAPTPNKEEEEWVDSRTAAKLLGVSPDYVRLLKHKFPHKKAGNHSQGHLLFLRSALIENYINN